MTNVTAESLLDELRRLEKCAHGNTTVEYAAAWGVGVEAARPHMKRLINAGLLKHSGKRRVMRMDGRADLVPVYQLVKPSKEK